MIAVVGLVPVGGELPLRTVPGVDARPARAHVVGARRAHRSHHAGKAERVELLLVEREVLEAPAHLLAGHHLALAEAFLRALDALDGHHRGDQAAHVEHLSHFLARPGALALVVHHREHILHDLRARARRRAASPARCSPWPLRRRPSRRARRPTTRRRTSFRADSRWPPPPSARPSSSRPSPTGTRSRAGSGGSAARWPSARRRARSPAAVAARSRRAWTRSCSIGIGSLPYGLSW